MMKREGFTLIEILVVIGIMSLLLACLIVVFKPDRVHIAGTKARILLIEMAINTYCNEFGEYPPDGYDYPVYAPNGIQLKGSACLTYFLAWKYPEENGGFSDTRLKKKVCFDSENIKEVAANNGSQYWTDYNTNRDFNQSGEILDLFNTPFQYDNCQDGLSLMSYGSNPDPRTSLNSGKSFTQTYDIWSYGPDSNSEKPTSRDDIIKGFKSRK